MCDWRVHHDTYPGPVTKELWHVGKGTAGPAVPGTIVMRQVRALLSLALTVCLICCTLQETSNLLAGTNQAGDGRGCTALEW